MYRNSSITSFKELHMAISLQIQDDVCTVLAQWNVTEEELAAHQHILLHKVLPPGLFPREQIIALARECLRSISDSRNS